MEQNWILNAICVHPKFGFGLGNELIAKSNQELIINPIIPKIAHPNEIITILIETHAYTRQDFPAHLTIREDQDGIGSRDGLNGTNNLITEGASVDIFCLESGKSKLSQFKIGVNDNQVGKVDYVIELRTSLY